MQYFEKHEIGMRRGKNRNRFGKIWGIESKNGKLLLAMRINR